MAESNSWYFSFTSSWSSGVVGWVSVESWDELDKEIIFQKLCYGSDTSYLDCALLNVGDLGAAAEFGGE
jgi:hypothetical protein